MEGDTPHNFFNLQIKYLIYNTTVLNTGGCASLGLKVKSLLSRRLFKSDFKVHDQWMKQ